MASDADHLARIYRYRRVSPQDVDTLGNYAKVLWVDATWIAAFMIEYEVIGNVALGDFCPWKTMR